METSPNMYTLPMKGTIERETRRRVEKARQVRLVVEGLAQASIMAQAVEVVTDQLPEPTPTIDNTIDNI